MSLTEKWTRNSFDVNAVRITEENIRAVAKWCEGSVYGRQDPDEGLKLYVQFGSVRYNRFREEKAYVGDWIIESEGEFRHYRDKSFRQTYQNKEAKRNAVLELVKQLLDEQDAAAFEGRGLFTKNLADEYSDKIMDFFGEEK